MRLDFLYQRPLLQFFFFEKICTYLPSSVCGPFCNTTVTLAGSAKVTKPNPLDLPDSAFFMTTQSITSPYREKYLCRLSWEVSHESPPTNSFLKNQQNIWRRNGFLFCFVKQKFQMRLTVHGALGVGERWPNCHVSCAEKEHRNPQQSRCNQTKESRVNKIQAPIMHCTTKDDRFFASTTFAHAYVYYQLPEKASKRKIFFTLSRHLPCPAVPSTFA